MNIGQIIPLVGQLLTLGLEIATIIDRAENLDPADKAALKTAIKDAQEKVTFWGDPEAPGPVSEDTPVPSND